MQIYKGRKLKGVNLRQHVIFHEKHKREQKN